MTIESLLTRPVSTLPSSATCVEAARRMKRTNIGSIVIEEDGRPIGILTDRDLAVRLVAEELDADSITVGRVMSTFPVFLTLERDLRAALDRHGGDARAPAAGRQRQRPPDRHHLPR